MEKRCSIEVGGVKHVNPIPSASKKGPFVVSGAISGADPASGKMPAELDAQCRQMFDNVRQVMSAAGGVPGSCFSSGAAAGVFLPPKPCVTR